MAICSYLSSARTWILSRLERSGKVARQAFSKYTAKPRGIIKACGRWFYSLWLAALSVAIVCGVLFVVVPVTVNYMGWDTTTAEAKFWLQTIAGNWSPDSFAPFIHSNPNEARETGKSESGLSEGDRYWFSFSAVVAILLNNGTILVIFGLIWRLIITWRNVMKMNLRQAFVSRDQMIKQALADNFAGDKDVKDKIEKAFRTGQADWIPHARAMFGKTMDEFLSDYGLDK